MPIETVGAVFVELQASFTCFVSLFEGAEGSRKVNLAMGKRLSDRAKYSGNQVTANQSEDNHFMLI